MLAERLADQGHEVFAISSSEFNKQRPSAIPDSGVQIISVNGPWGKKAVIEIKDIVRRLNLTSVILQFVPASFKKSFRLQWALSRFSCQKVTAFHAIWGKGLDRLWGFVMLLGCSKIIATNSEIISIIERRLPMLLNKTFWIPIASNILPEPRAQIEDRPAVPVISYFGMLYPGKGLDLILDTLQELVKRKKRFVFKFIGGRIIHYQDYESQFFNRVKLRGLDDVVEFLGHVPSKEVSQWLNQSRFVFLPYDQGLSDRRGSLMAALAHGRPVLTTPPIGPLPNFMNNSNIMWPKKVTVKGFADLAENLIVDDALVEKLQTGAEQLSCQFDWHNIAADHETVLGQAP
jgi:glycosyltransferase involved in cell wall biosynthesis